MPISSDLGWVPLRLWEHEAVDAAVGKVVEVLASRGHPRALRIRGEGVQSNR
jgi:DNA mismatch endonuclease (patch repair protein)